MTKTLRECIKEAEQKKVAIGHFNISNLEALWGILNAARVLNLPVIIGVSEGERAFVGVRQAAALVQSLRAEFDFPIFLNADHSYSFEKVKEAINAGFNAVIFDGVKLPLEENIKVTKECVKYARDSGRDVLVEAELGFIGQSSKIIDKIPEGAGENFLTSVEEAKKFVAETGVDLLAPAVGNLHGILAGGHNPRLNIKRIEEIRTLAGVPLVLHGGSGISDEDFVSAISAGISIVHINTEIRVAFRDALKKSLQENPDEVAPYKFMKDTVKAVEQVVEKRLRLFNKL